MTDGVIDLQELGDRVEVNSFEGFGGPATVVETRTARGSRCRVRMAVKDRGSSPVPV